MTDDQEVQRLRDRVAQLETELQTAREAPPGAAKRPPARERWRSITAGALIVVACLLAPLSVTAVWANNQVSDTDRYVETVSPLAENPGVQAAIADEVSTAILEQIDVQTITADAVTALTAQELPDRVKASLQAFQVPLANAIEGFVRDQVTTIVQSDQFAEAWDAANRVAHDQVVALLSGEQGGAVTAQNDQITINLAPIIEQVKQRLVDQGFTLAANIPTVDKTFVLAQSGAVTKAQGLYRLLDTLGTWLPVIVLVLFAIGVYVAKGHRRALLLGALGIVAAMLVMGVLLAIGRVLYLDNRPTEILPRDVASSVFDTLVRFLRYGLRSVAVLALIVALAAFLTGPSTTAVRTRGALGRGIGWLRGSAEARGVQTGKVGVWTYAHKRALEFGLVGLGAFTLTFWERPTVSVVIWTAVVVVLAVGVVELVGRPPSEASTEGPPSDVSTGGPPSGASTETAAPEEDAHHPVSPGH